MRKILSSILFTSLFFQTACNLAPRYTRPEMSLPTSWQTENNDASTLCNQNWWSALGDEVLDSLIGEAVQNNKDVQIAAWRVMQYFAQYQVSLSAFFPQFSASGNALKEKLAVDSNFLFPGLSTITPDYNIKTSVSFEFDFWCKTKNTSSAAYSQYLAEIENRRIVVLSLVSSVVQAYVVLRQLDLQVDIAKCMVRSKRQALDVSTMRFREGEIAEMEVEQAIASYESSLASLVNLEAKVPEQENMLSVLLGKNPGPIPRGKTLKQLFLPSKVPTGVPSDILTQRPDIRRAEDQLRAANANIGVARAAFFPQFSLAALYGLDNLKLYRLFNPTSETWLLGGSFLQTLFSGGELLGRLRMTEAQKKEMVFSYQQTILTALKEVNNSLIGLDKAQEVYTAENKKTEALRAYVQLIWSRYCNGQAQYQEVLEAQDMLFASEEGLASAQADQFLVLVELYKSLGGGWVVEEDQKIRLQ